MVRLPAGDFDYEALGPGYAQQRRADPRIGALILQALGDAASVLNVGAGAGSYEPEDRYVVAVEPSAAMRAQRPPHLTRAVCAVAERLPFDDGAFDAAMALVTVHQWRDPRRGLSELRRVTRGRVLVLTFDRDALDRFWLAAYAPELIAVERGRYPPIDLICSALGGSTEIRAVAVPSDCVDGFTEAFYARPEMLLDPAVRRSQSAWGFVEEAAHRRAIETLAHDLECGAWDERYGSWRHQPSFDGSLRLIVDHPA